MESQTENPDYFETGYLTIHTTYENDSPTDEQSKVNANGLIASRVWEIIEEKQSHDSPIRGAVVETVRDGLKDIYVEISICATEQDWGPDPLNAVAHAIEAALANFIKTNSQIKVDKVEVAKEKKPDTPTGLEGLP